MKAEKYTLKIDLNVLNHLGLNLYSNLPAVLSELIANAWDADATEVKITTSKNEITIEDDGCGMNAEELNQKFLSVGYQRRKEMKDDLTSKLKRKVMGRKGIGKLSIFSIAEHIEIYTKKEDTLGISMKVKDIQKKIEQKALFHPTEIKINEDNKISGNTGTRIILKKLKKRVTSSIDNNLSKRVARRFDIWSDQFKVSINGTEISIEDRDYYNKLEFAVTYGGYTKENFKKIDKDTLHTKPAPEGISGWIGLVKKSDGLQDGSDNLNKISVLSRGKVALEDILELYREGGLYTKYLIGEIKADFLDITGKEDIATSSRQNFIQNDERFETLKTFIFKELKFIQKSRADYKNKEGARKASEIPAIKDWFKSLKGDAGESAKKLFGKINQIATDEEHRKTLFTHGVLAFEHLRHKEKLQQLDKLDVESLEEAVKLFSSLDDIEATLYHQITQGRLEIINKLILLNNDDARENVVQELIYSHLWLLDPSWDRATETPEIEQTVKKGFQKVSKKLSEEEKNARIDIRYKKAAGKHIIIELKRASVQVTKGNLSDQVLKYKRALKKQLDLIGETGVVIECVCLLGKLPHGWDDETEKQKGEHALAAEDIRIVTYQQLINDAQIMYKNYLEKGTEKGRIRKLLETINNDQH